MKKVLLIGAMVLAVGCVGAMDKDLLDGKITDEKVNERFAKEGAGIKGFEVVRQVRFGGESCLRNNPLFEPDVKKKCMWIRVSKWCKNDNEFIGGRSSCELQGGVDTEVIKRLEELKQREKKINEERPTRYLKDRDAIQKWGAKRLLYEKGVMEFNLLLSVTEIENVVKTVVKHPYGMWCLEFSKGTKLSPVEEFLVDAVDTAKVWIKKLLEVEARIKEIKNNLKK